jgi:glyoxylase-like metal-dependent hydrolase (beta-lactamase superfamily II)
MQEESAARRFNWRVLQGGQLPLRPDGHLDSKAEHRCTITLLWPEGTTPSPDNTVIVDPCFTDKGYKLAVGQLEGLNSSFAVVNRMFLTHPHGDHSPCLPPEAPSILFDRIAIKNNPQAEGLAARLCPGHHPLLLALVFQAVDGALVWAVGDAVLDEDWLRHWGVYHPNGYTPTQIADTWRSVAKIMAAADIIIPGHGPEIRVTCDLLHYLIDTFPRAPHADLCPEVSDQLRARLEKFAGCGSA